MATKDHLENVIEKMLNNDRAIPNQFPSCNGCPYQIPIAGDEDCYVCGNVDETLKCGQRS